MSNIGNNVSNLVTGIIGAVVLLIVGIALGPTVLDAAADINSTSMSGVTMGTAIVTLAGFIGAFYYLGIVLAAIATFWAVVKFK